MKKLFLLFALTIFTTIGFAQSNDALQLSLEDAILLAVRDNPNVQQQCLTNTLQKFSLFVQEWEFTPHFHLYSSASVNRTRFTPQSLITAQPTRLDTNRGYTVQPDISLLTPIGTTIQAIANNNWGENHYNPRVALTVTQPLLRGFGRAVVETALNNAMDDLRVARLNTEGILRNTVTTVINAYLDIVNQEKTLEIDRDAVTRAEKSVEQTRIFIKAGRKAGNELVTVQANVATARSKLETDKNALVRSRYALLAAIGLDPNACIQFSSLNLDSLTKKYQLPTLEETKALALQNDVTYQIDQLTLHGSKMRSLVNAKNTALPRLDLVVNTSTGGGSGGGKNAGFNSLFNRGNYTNGVSLNFDYTFDNQRDRQAILSAEIALKSACLALKKSRWEKETNAINNWNEVLSSEKALQYAEDAERLQQKTYNISYQKYLHGLVDSLELQTAQVALIQAEQSLLSARITYLKALVNLDSLVGNTLCTWNIRVRI